MNLPPPSPLFPRRATPAARSARRAFTLTEVLIASVLMAILVALLFPMIERAIDSSRQASCMGNLRQLGAAATLYANDNRGFLPWAMERSSVRWETVIQPYLGTYRTWDKNQTNWQKSGPYSCPATVRNYWLGYGWNYDGIGLGPTDPRGGPTRVGQKPNCVMIADSIKSYDPKVVVGEVNMIYPPSARMKIPRPHREGLNTLFVDGRVEWHSADQWYENTVWR